MYIHTHTMYTVYSCAHAHKQKKKIHTQTQKDTHISARYSYEETLFEVVLEDRTVAVKY